MRTVDSRPFMRDFFLLGRVNMPHRAALDAEPRASCRASSARLDVGATAATARWSLARRTRPLPRTLGAMTPLVRAGQGVRARRRLTRPWRPSPRVVWWDSTGSSRSHGRSTRCARYARTHPRLRAGPRPTTTAPRSSSVIEQPTTTHNAFSPRPVSTQLPHKVKARKEIQAWPLKVKLGAEYDLVAKKFQGHADCHDSLLGGELSFDILHSNVEYTKRFDLGEVSSIGVRARCDLSNLGSPGRRADRGWDASLGFTIEPKRTHGPLGANTRVSNTRGSGYDIVTEVPVSQLVSAEVCGHLTLPLPRAEFHARTGGGGRLTVGEGGLGMHVAQINAVIDL